MTGPDRPSRTEPRATHPDPSGDVVRLDDLVPRDEVTGGRRRTLGESLPGEREPLEDARGGDA